MYLLFLFNLVIFDCKIRAPLAEMKRKILPQWLREGLEKLEREKVKKLEREAREASAHKHSSRPSWRDELDEEEGGERMAKGDGEHSTLRSYRHHIRPHSSSPAGVSILYMHMFT